MRLKTGEMKKDFLGKFEEAIEDLDLAISLNPKKAILYYNRGICNINLNQTEIGCLDLSKAGELGLFKAYEGIKEYCD